MIKNIPVGLNLHVPSAIAANQHWSLQVGWYCGLMPNATQMMLIHCVVCGHRCILFNYLSGDDCRTYQLLRRTNHH